MVRKYADPEMLGTSNLLACYERLFGRLDRQTRRRILEAARARGWDRDESWRPSR